MTSIALAGKPTASASCASASALWRRASSKASRVVLRLMRACLNSKEEAAPASSCFSRRLTSLDCASACCFRADSVSRAAKISSSFPRTRLRTCQAVAAKLRRAASDKSLACSIRWPRLPAVSTGISKLSPRIHGGGVVESYVGVRLMVGLGRSPAVTSMADAPLHFARATSRSG